MRIDLHTHSTASDGTDTPGALVRVAVAAGLDAVALTDHDTTAGWAEACGALDGLAPGLRLVRGAEFSCVDTDGQGRTVSLHLLGYLFRPDAPAIVAEQDRLAAERRHRFRAMAERMAADGLPVDADRLLAELPAGTPPGRPHLARALLRAGLVESVDEAFTRYLAAGAPYYIGRADTDVHTAVAMVRAAGGVPVLAHPFARTRGPVLSPEALERLVGDGLAGLEVDHPDHAEPDRQRLHGLARDLDLLVTGSSDYHGTNKTVRLGQETTPAATVDRIEAAATGVPVIGG